MRISLTVTTGPAKGQVFTFDEPDRFLFGRAADARVSLSPDDRFVSRHHFLLEIAPPNCRVTDLDSKNGLFVNDIRYGGSKPPGPGVRQAPAGTKDTLLKHGDEIVVGDTRMKIAIAIDACCVDCGKAAPDEQREVLALVGGAYLCAQCRSKQLAKGAPARPVPAALPLPPKARAVHCTRCKKDVTAEAGARGQAKGAQYVCKACRAKEKADPQGLLDSIFRPAVAAAAAAAPAVAVAPVVAGAPAIRGYRIEKELGRGGMGMVYKATEKGTGRTVAIKMMLPKLAANRGAVVKFLRELEVTRQLRHPNIVEMFDYGEIQGTFYCILEFVDGMDLGKYVESRGGSVGLEEAAPLMMDILAGLAHAHGAEVRFKIAGGESRTFRGIVHRDLKPENVLLARTSSGYSAKVADFGLAKSFEAAGLTDYTVAGQCCGTPMYWPREQITQYKYLAPPTDVFSIAAVFYEMLTGSCMRNGFNQMLLDCKRRGRDPSAADIMNVIVKNPATPLHQRNSAIPERVAAVIDCALGEAEVPANETEMREKLAKLRYPHAGAFREALGKALRASGTKV